MDKDKQKYGGIVKAKTTNPYTQIPNSTIDDKTISLKALGLLVKLLKLPEDWIIYKTQLHDFCLEKRDSVINAFNELVDSGYIIATDHRDEHGMFQGVTYVVYPTTCPKTPITESPVTDNPEPVNPEPGNTELTKKIIQQRKDNTNTPIVPKGTDVFADFIERFNLVRNTRYKPVSIVRRKFMARITEGFTVDELMAALKSAMHDSYHIETKYKYLTPEFFTRADKIERFLNSPGAYRKDEVTKIISKDGSEW